MFIRKKLSYDKKSVLNYNYIKHKYFIRDGLLKIEIIRISKKDIAIRCITLV